jgi:hypothetical protein
MEERDPAQPTDEPRRKAVGDQLPEEAPEDHVDRPQPGRPGTGADHAAAPSTSSPEEGDPQQATGNPHAAG